MAGEPEWLADRTSAGTIAVCELRGLLMESDGSRKGLRERGRAGIGSSNGETGVLLPNDVGLRPAWYTPRAGDAGLLVPLALTMLLRRKGLFDCDRSSLKAGDPSLRPVFWHGTSLLISIKVCSTRMLLSTRDLYKTERGKDNQARRDKKGLGVIVIVVIWLSQVTAGCRAGLYL